MAWVNITSTSAVPTDGRGTASTASTDALTYTNNNTLFTPTTATGTTMLATLTNCAVGSIIATSDGYYGICTAFDATPAPDIITVDRWRAWGYPDGSGVPAANADVTCYTALHNGGLGRWIIDSIEVTKATVADIITIKNICGSPLKSITMGGHAADTCAPVVLPYNMGGPPFEGPQGWTIDGPFSASTSASTCTATIYYRVISGK